MSGISILREHSICVGHRLVGHESKCSHLHGHNYKFVFEVALMPGRDLDKVGRVLDFGQVKDTLCEWLEHNWDHKMVLFAQDPMLPELRNLDPDGICVVDFNPSAENMAHFMVTVMGPLLLPKDVYLRSCRIFETEKCSAFFELLAPRVY